MAKSYSESIETYLKKGYICKIRKSEEKPKKVWYLPHFLLLRPDKTTTKTRIVFDGSAQCNRISLSDTIHQGPKLQLELFDVLLWF